MSFANVTSSAFLYCPPVTQTLFTTIYETVLPAACETSKWLATYTITETCLGNKADYVTPTMPPGFIVTTVSCPICPESEVVITCPGAQPTGFGRPTVQISGNGVTATIIASPATIPTNSSPATPTGVPPAYQGSVGGNGGNGGNGGSGGNGGNGGNGSNGSNGNNGSNGSNGNVGNGSKGNGTVSNPPPMVITGAAASLKRSLMVGAGLAFMVGPFILL
ncbi:hypothetical protein F4824DRAFT_162905 [Ustulina deusta]|nr:hypothetical protein F4824DRAFT_162905 [Ustulina deusta]